MKQKQNTYRFSEEHDKWLEEQAKKRRCSKNYVLRLLIIEKMAEKPKRQQNK